MRSVGRDWIAQSVLTQRFQPRDTARKLICRHRNQEFDVRDPTAAAPRIRAEEARDGKEGSAKCDNYNVSMSEVEFGWRSGKG